MAIEFLTENDLRAWCDLASIPEEGVVPLVEVLQKIQAEPVLQQAYREFTRRTILGGAWHREWSPIEFDPGVEQILSQQTSLFYLVCYLSAIPQAMEQYHRRGIGMDVFRETMWDIGFFYTQDSDTFGYWMFDQFPWIWRHLTCELFRLGRLQFILVPFDHAVTAFRHKQNGSIVLLADPNRDLRPDGCAEGAGGKPSGSQPWRPDFATQEGGWLGHIVSPYGYALHESCFLSSADWEVALQEGDMVLEIHIPRGEPLTADACRDSFRKAAAFFKWQYPDQHIRASFCHTWFFTPQLQQILPSTSRIVQFQREFYLFPFPGRPGFLWNFVFGEKYPDPSSAPRDTYLRRSVLEWLERDQELFDLPGLCFHGPDEWGNQVYMRAWDNHHAAQNHSFGGHAHASDSRS